MLERVWRKGNLPTLLVGNVNWSCHYGKQYGGSFKKKLQIGLSYDSAILLFWHESGQNYHSKRCMHPYVHSSSIHDSQDMETA